MSFTTMSLLTLSIILTLGVLFGVAEAWGSSSNPDAVLLESIKALTLYRGKMTNGRRSSPVPQINCVGGTARGMFEPEVIQCVNVGFDGYDVQWECKTDMMDKYRFGYTTVTCEGYSNPDDPYILRGSCGVEYTLEYTEKGRDSNGHNQGGNGYFGGGYDSYYGSSSPYSSSSSDGIGSLIMMALIAFLGYKIYQSCTRMSYGSGANPGYPGSGYFGGGGGNGGGGFGSGFGGSTYGDSCAPSAPPASSSGGGFWTGAATGGVLGYLFGRRNNYGTGYGYRAPTYGAPTRSFFGGGGGGFSSGTRSFGGGGSSFSSSSRTASGFGGTRRR